MISNRINELTFKLCLIHGRIKELIYKLCLIIGRISELTYKLCFHMRLSALPPPASRPPPGTSGDDKGDTIKLFVSLLMFYILATSKVT